MKYTRIQKVVKKVCDDDISDISTIKTILGVIQKKQLFCSFVIEADYQLVYISKARILDLGEEFFNYRSFTKRATVKDRSNYKDLKELRLETEIEQIVSKDDRDDRWLLLDLDDEEK